MVKELSRNEADDLTGILKKLHALKRHGVIVVPSLMTAQPNIDLFITQKVEGKSEAEIYNEKHSTKIFVGKFWSSSFILEVLNHRLNYCVIHKLYEDAKIFNDPMISLVRDFNFKKFKKEEEKLKEDND